MALGGMTTRALLLGVSIVSMGALVSETALAQAAAQAGDVQPQKPKPAKKKRAAAKPAAVPAQVASARAQIGRPGQSLDEKIQELPDDKLVPAYWTAALFVVVALLEWFAAWRDLPRLPVMWTVVALCAISDFIRG